MHLLACHSVLHKHTHTAIFQFKGYGFLTIHSTVLHSRDRCRADTSFYSQTPLWKPPNIWELLQICHPSFRLLSSAGVWSFTIPYKPIVQLWLKRNVLISDPLRQLKNVQSTTKIRIMMITIIILYSSYMVPAAFFTSTWWLLNMPVRKNTPGVCAGLSGRCHDVIWVSFLLSRWTYSSHYCPLPDEAMKVEKK